MLKIKRLHLENFRGYKEANFSFGDFTCLIGPNGIGKTTILEAVTLLCSSLDFGDDPVPSIGGWVPTVTASSRRANALKKNIRGIDEPGGAKGFLAEGVFDRDGQEYVVSLNETGFTRNDILKAPWWWHGLVYFTKLDSDNTNFFIPKGIWPKFAAAYTAITGINVEVESEFDPGDGKVVIDRFWMMKPGGRISSKKGSAGERKIAKAMSQIVNLPPERMPDIVLVDNIEMHVANSRHLAMVEEYKKLFAERQIIATTHSMPIIQSYQPREHIVDIEAM